MPNTPGTANYPPKPIFIDILSKGRTSNNVSGMFNAGSFETRDWFRDKASEVRNVKIESLINQNQHYAKNQVKPGFMYLFNYDPKMKEELPYYDRWPLIFPFSSSDDGFLGMNLHYLPPIYRARLMDNLYGLITNEKYDETTRIRASYSFLNSAAKYKYFTPCIKKYLTSHVRSRFLLIPANEWDIALFLPLQRFAKKGANFVYKDSRATINGL